MIFQSVSFNSIMDLYLKNIFLQPGHDYSLELEICGGCINVYIANYGIREGGGSHYISENNTWRPFSFRFSTLPTADDQALSLFADWGIAFVKKYGEIIPTASGNTYIRHVRLIDLENPEHNLLTGGEFSAPHNDASYLANWDGAILGKKGKQLGVDIVPDPVLPQGHCLLLPETVSLSLYPKQLPISTSTCGVLKNNPTVVSLALYDGYPLLLVKKGRAELSCNGRTVAASDNHALILPTAEASLTLHPCKDSEYYWLNIYGEYAECFLRKLGFFDSPVHTIHDMNALIPHLNSLLSTASGDVSYLYVVSSHLQLFLAEWEKQQRATVSGVHRAAIEKIAVEIQQTPERPISNDELAAELGITPKHFISIFKNYIGMPPQKYRLHQLMGKACILLQNTTMTVQEISYALDVEDPLYFSRLFRSYRGVSPLKYRKHHRP
ncbi:MAG: helix-turn-helix transcriptional regulator [Clostridia bacterium]|nr:helix-turn-helix transcriptional regulator [Clostridia bacterium]